MNEILITTIVAVMSAIITAIFTIQIKFSTSKEDAFNQIKSFIINSLNVIWTIYLIYSMGIFLFSKQPLTRPEILKLIVLSVYFSIMICLILIEKIIVLVKEMNSVNKEHLLITKKISQCISCGNVIKSNEDNKYFS